MIDAKKEEILYKLKKSLDYIEYRKIGGITFGITNINDVFRNDMVSLAQDINLPVDVLLIPQYKNRICSLRSINTEADVKTIAEYYGGGGHKTASACPMTDNFIRDFGLQSKFEDMQEKNL